MAVNLASGRALPDSEKPSFARGRASAKRQSTAGSSGGSFLAFLKAIADPAVSQTVVVRPRYYDPAAEADSVQERPKVSFEVLFERSRGKTRAEMARELAVPKPLSRIAAGSPILRETRIVQETVQRLRALERYDAAADFIVKSVSSAVDSEFFPLIDALLQAHARQLSNVLKAEYDRAAKKDVSTALVLLGITRGVRARLAKRDSLLDSFRRVVAKCKPPIVASRILSNVH